MAGDSVAARRAVREATTLARELGSELQLVGDAAMSVESAELLVVGLPRRAALGSAFVGGLFRNLARNAPCPVVAVPPRAPGGADPRHDRGAARSIVCGVDGTKASRAAAAVAASLAARLDLRQIAVHAHQRVSRVSRQPIEGPVEDDPAGEDEARAWRVLERAVAELDACAEGRFLNGRPAEALELVAAREQARLIVVGSRRRRKLRPLVLGSVAARLVSASARPIVIVPRSVRIPPAGGWSSTNGRPVALR